MSGVGVILPARFWRRVDRTGAAPCWLWIGRLTTGGYGGRVHINGEYDSPHRWSYRAHVGPIPKHLEINHRCRVRNCVNPDHLEVVTHLRNMADLKKEFCHRGHPMAGDNLYLHETGKRECRACNRERQRAFQHRRKQMDGAIPGNDRYDNHGSNAWSTVAVESWRIERPGGAANTPGPADQSLGGGRRS